MHTYQSFNAFYFQYDCSFFVSESNNCTLYQSASIKLAEKEGTNAGICPKADKNRAWIWGGPEPIYLPDSVPEKQLWCGEASGSVCTFPFKIDGSELIYEPYKDSGGVSRCGTLDNSVVPTDYDSVNDLDVAVPCKGE